MKKMENTREVTCRCFANMGGHCAAESCEGEITAFDIVGQPTQEEIRQFYKACAELFKEEEKS